MTRGRPRKPDILKKLEGNRDKSGSGLNLNPLTPDGHPIRPVYVTGYGVEVWDQIIGSMPADLYSATDVIALAAFCVAANQFRSSTEELERDGLTLTGINGIVKVNPASTIQAQALSALALWGSRLGLDPVSRASMQMPKSKKEASKFEGLMNVPLTLVEAPQNPVSEATG